MRDELTREHKVVAGLPTDELAVVLWTFVTGYVPTAEAVIVRDCSGAMQIVPGLDVPEGSRFVVTRYRVAGLMRSTGTTPDDLRTWKAALVLAVVIWGLR